MPHARLESRVARVSHHDPTPGEQGPNATAVGAAVINDYRKWQLRAVMIMMRGVLYLLEPLS